MKKRTLYIFFLLLLVQFTFGQTEGEKVLAEEFAFAEKSKKDGTKSAFLAYLGYDAIIFSEGKPLNGKQFWSQLDFNDRLMWSPFFVEVANSQDLAYTIGTYKYFLQNDLNKPAEIGFFTSIWKKESGQWKVALDIGIPTKNEEIYLSKSKANLSPKVIQKANNQTFKNDTTDLKSAILTADYLLSNNLKRSSEKGKSYAKNAQKFINPTLKYLFVPQSSGIASSGDLAYVYGTISVDRKIGNYLRIWKKQSRKTWKVVLEIATL